MERAEGEGDDGGRVVVGSLGFEVIWGHRVWRYGDVDDTGGTSGKVTFGGL